MKLKPLYISDGIILVGLLEDFDELCVLDGLVVEIDLNKGKALSDPVSGLSLLKRKSFTPIRQHEKHDYTRMISRKLKRRTLRKIEEDLETPPESAIESLSWIPERLS